MLKWTGGSRRKVSTVSSPLYFLASMIKGYCRKPVAAFDVTSILNARKYCTGFNSALVKQLDNNKKVKTRLKHESKKEKKKKEIEVHSGNICLHLQ
jgi:hypothetical protein